MKFLQSAVSTSLHSSLLLQKPWAKRFLSSSAAIFEASVTFHVQSGLCLGHMICYSWLLMPTTVFLWLLTSAIFKHFALCCIFSHFFFSCLSSFAHSLFCFFSRSAFPLCVPPQRSGLQLKLIQTWKGSDDFSWKNCIIFCNLLWTLLLPSCLFYSNTLKQSMMEKRLHSLCLVQQHLISKISTYSYCVTPKKRVKNGFSLVLSGS